MFGSYPLSLAYKFLVLQLILADANFVSRQLDLPGPSPIEAEDVKYLYVTPPSVGTGFGANLKTTNFAFGYSGSGASSSVRMLSPTGRDYEGWFLSQYPIWATTPSLVDTNTAYQMASQWIATVSVDVVALEKKYRVSVSQLEVEKGVLPRSARDQKAPGATQKLPVYYICWGEGQFEQFGKISGSPAVEVTILGTTRQLMELRIADGAVRSRPRLEVPNAEEIASFPDAPLLPLLQNGTNLAALNNLLIVPPEHETARKAAMLAEATRYLARLSLLGLSNLESSNLVQSYVWPSSFGLGGNLRTETFNFRFNERGELFAVLPLFRSDFDITGQTVIGTNEAYRVASNRLESVGINVRELQTKAGADIWRRSLPPSQGKGRVWLSSYEVVWETPSLPVVQIWLHAVTGETLRYFVYAPELLPSSSPAPTSPPANSR